MSAEFRKVNLAMQSDAEFRQLPVPAQHLYYTMWCRPDLSYCGVLDWRPGRIAAGASDWTASSVREAAACLEARHFIVTDEETEECLIRSWVRFDGLLKQPRMAVSFANAYHAVSSNTIRGVIVHEAQKLREREPDLIGWTKDQVQEVLTFPSIDPKVRATPDDPFGPGLAQTEGRVSGSVSVPPTTATATATSQTATEATPRPAGGKRRKPETSLPEDWKPNAKHEALALEAGLSLSDESFRFRNHAMTNDRRTRDWDAAFRMWLSKAKDYAPAKPARQLTEAHKRAPEAWQ